MKHLISQSIRSKLRRIVDRCQYRPSRDALILGASAQWCLRADPLRDHLTPVMLSGGVGNDISFEMEFIERFGGKVFIYDPSPTGLHTMRRIGHCADLHFTPAAFAAYDGKVAMAKPQSIEEGSWTVPTTQDAVLDELPAVTVLGEMQRLELTTLDVLKLDIEGFEYDVLHSVFEKQILPKQILVEFHDFFPNITKEKTRHCLRAIRSQGYACFYKQRYEYSFCLPD